MGRCYSYRQFCSLGPLPPRTPARPDPQVPKDAKLDQANHWDREEYVASPLDEDPSFMGEYSHEAQRAGFARWRVHLPRTYN